MDVAAEEVVVTDDYSSNDSSGSTSIKSQLLAGSLKLTPVVKKRSPIWKYISCVIDPAKHVELYYVACNKCHVAFKVDKSGGMGKYSKHLSNAHKIKVEEKEGEDFGDKGGPSQSKQSKLSFASISPV